MNFLPVSGLPSVFLILLFAITGCVSVPGSFSPEQALAPEAFSHATFDQVLASHVKKGEVDYPSIARDARFTEYLALINRVNPQSLPARRRLAFWLNVYNAHAIAGVLNGATPATWAGKYRFFLADDHMVGGEAIDLYSLEHGIIIPLGEPRIHFALVCAAQSCPPLRSEAYRGADLEQQLQDQARQFINNPEMNSFDRSARVAELSKIFDWFKQDFSPEGTSGLPAYVARFVNDPALAADLQSGQWTVQFKPYNWQTNGPLPEATE